MLTDLLRAADAPGLRDWIDAHRAGEIADELVRRNATERAFLFRLLPKDRAVRVFERLGPARQQDLIEDLRQEDVAHLVEELDPDDRARLIEEMPAGLARRLMMGLSEPERRMTATLLGYPEESAGRIMSPEVLRLAPEQTVGAALARVRAEGDRAEQVNVLPVTDDARLLLGSVGLDALVLAPEGARVADLLAADAPYATADDDQEVAARLMQDAGAMALPVVDGERRLLGVITVADALRVLRDEATEDHARAGGAEPLRDHYLASSLFRVARSRAVWLLLLVLGALLTVNVLEAFEATLAQVVTLALFIPLLIGTGGNAGAQVSTTVVRALALGEVRAGDLMRVLRRELAVGLLLGVMLGALGFLPLVGLYGRDIALVVSLTVVSVVAWASLVGACLPFAARRLRLDPALVSAPLVTTLVDATGLLIYLLIARAVLGI